MRLANRTWPQVTAASTVLAIPLGSTEQHGPHLPLSTDSDIAVAVADGFAARRSDVVVAPVIPYGSSGEHAAFAGTLSIGQEALEHVIVELVRSADAFRGVVIVNGHGGNAAPLARAVGCLTAEGRRVVAWTPAYGGDLHAGRSETSLMLALHPSTVDTAAAEAGDPRPLAELIGTMRRGGVAAVSPNGVLGDPAGASAAEGMDLLGSLVEALDAAARAAFP